MDVVVLLQPYGNPGSFGEPLGIFSGVASVAGDATGGHSSVTFVPQNPTTTPTLEDQRRAYVFFLDGATIHDGPATPVSMSAEVFTHWARPNVAIAIPAQYNRIAGVTIAAGQFKPTFPLIELQVSRLPIFWDSQELAGTANQIVRLILGNNINSNEAEFSCYGRYYDKQVLSNRAFGRLIAPEAVSQFSGRA